MLWGKERYRQGSVEGGLGCGSLDPEEKEKESNKCVPSHCGSFWCNSSARLDKNLGAQLKPMG